MGVSVVFWVAQASRQSHVWSCLANLPFSAIILITSVPRSPPVPQKPHDPRRTALGQPQPSHEQAADGVEPAPEGSVFGFALQVTRCVRSHRSSSQRALLVEIFLAVVLESAVSRGCSTPFSFAALLHSLARSRIASLAIAGSRT